MAPSQSTSSQATRRLTIEYPTEVLWALQQEPDEFEAEARLLLALKLYETGRLSSGLAARLAGIPRGSFIVLLGRYGLSPFGETPDELESDLAHARSASHSE
jgi:predicted HTH domain antitoxin